MLVKMSSAYATTRAGQTKAPSKNTSQNFKNEVCLSDRIFYPKRLHECLTAHKKFFSLIDFLM